VSFHQTGDQCFKCKRLLRGGALSSLEGNPVDFAILELVTIPSIKGASFGQLTRTDEVFLATENDGRLIRSRCHLSIGSIAYPFAKSLDHKFLPFGGCRGVAGQSGSPLVNQRGEVVALFEGMNSKRNREFFKKSGDVSISILKATNSRCLAETSPEFCRERDDVPRFLKLSREWLVSSLKKSLPAGFEIELIPESVSGILGEGVSLRAKSSQNHSSSKSVCVVRPVISGDGLVTSWRSADCESR
jgi:hypothetical protein